jgi:hypothetical protein
MLDVVLVTGRGGSKPSKAVTDYGSTASQKSLAGCRYSLMDCHKRVISRRRLPVPIDRGVSIL